MKILHVVGGLDRGGTETWLVQVLRHIDRRHYQFDFVVESERRYAYQADVEALGSRVINCGPHKKFVAYSWNFLRSLRKYGPYDCIHVHVHYYSGLPLALASIAGIPVRIVHSHSVLPDPTYRRRVYRSVMRRLIWLSATRGLAFSRRAADVIFPPCWEGSDRWRVTSYGMDLRPFTTPADRAAIRQELGIAADTYVVGHVGSFQGVKNHLFLLEIAREIVAVEPDCRLLLIGDGPLHTTVERKVRSLGLEQNMIFAGPRSDVPRLMKGAMDAFVFPSLSEGLGFAVLEAQAAGLLCLVSDTVPEEADVGIGQFFRASLRDSPREWARKILAFRDFVERSRETSPTLENFRPIAISTEQLVKLYGFCQRG